MLRRLALTVLVVAALAPALRGDAAPPVLIEPGVTLAGVSVGGMSNEQAQAALRPAFARPVRLVYADRSWRLRPARFGARVTIADGVVQALGAQAGAAVSLVPKVNQQEVRRFVNALDKRVSVPALDAELSGGGAAPTGVTAACPTGARPTGSGQNKLNCDDLSPVHDQMIALIKLAFE